MSGVVKKTLTTVLVYGDSNVWGEMPGDRRLPCEQHWANILQQKLGNAYRIVQEGLSGRFAGRHSWDGEDYCDGQHCFEAIYRSASPVDIVVLALGTNDTADTAATPTEQIVADVLWYENKAKGMPPSERITPSRFVYVLIPNLTELRTNGINRNELEKRSTANDILKQKVENFVEADNIDLSSDGKHFSPKGHQQMAEIVYNKIMELEK
jgi:lysophospholipase L1-like esterase